MEEHELREIFRDIANEIGMSKTPYHGFVANYLRANVDDMVELWDDE